ncbi:hypothetical protein CRE_05948 [Caenorhabditis remanei]|uniref:Uncharacterized protein n=1 Tax=Caenorhabditis remanei TaxID=31234 RepID=E3MZF6_CAERE|nr:hypothetical protein CRE_05948 [Caenorhabditis remanei]
MSNNLEVRLHPNGHPFIYIPQLPPGQQSIPPMPPVPQLPQASPLTQLAPIPQQQVPLPPNPFDQILNSTLFPFPPPLPVGMGTASSVMDVLNGQFPFFPPLFNPFLQISPPFLTFPTCPPTPVPLMSLRIPTPPKLRAHPYLKPKEREDTNIRRPRQRNNSHRANYRTDKTNVQVVEGRTANPFYSPPRQYSRQEIDRSQKQNYPVSNNN